MRKMIMVISLLGILQLLHGQDGGANRVEGRVTFKASKNIYVRFARTDVIGIGDTLSRDQNGVLVPCMVVERKSSSSCICREVEDCAIAVDEVVVYEKKEEVVAVLPPQEEEEAGVLANEVDEEVSPKLEEREVKPSIGYNKERIRARASAASYSNMTNDEDGDRHRTLLRFSLDADHIGDSKFSLETYINYRKNFVQGSFPESYRTGFLNIYNLAMTYDVDSTMRISLGRKINRKISSLGPIDGLQVEKYFGAFYSGAVVGFKPDINGFGFNSNLYEYGGYVGHNASRGSVYTMTTLGFLEQHNGGPVDRRYVYLQHSSTLWRSLTFFTSAEVDIYAHVHGASSNEPRLTNLYVSTRYRPSRRISFMLSYDTRKRIIYYETLRTEVERLLADDEHRQGIRGRIHFKPFKYVHSSVSYSRRFQSDSQNKSNNVNVSLSHARMPLISGRMSINVNVNESNYLTSRIMAVRYSRSLIRKKLQGDFYYRMVRYAYGGNEFDRAQNYYGANLSLRLNKSLRFSILGELSTRESEERIRINTKLIKRFKS